MTAAIEALVENTHLQEPTYQDSFIWPPVSTFAVWSRYVSPGLGSIDFALAVVINELEAVVILLPSLNLAMFNKLGT